MTERIERMLGLVDQDFEATNGFLRGVLSTATTVRTWAITIWLALAGLAVRQDSWELGVLSLLVLMAFAIVDAYHLDLYQQALGHARRLERLYGDYYGALARAEFMPDEFTEFVIDLETHAYGFYRRLGRFRLRRSFSGASRMFALMYLSLMVLSGVLTVVTAL